VRLLENPAMDVRERFPNTWKYQPFFNERGWVSEDARCYVTRMQSTVLPNWPEEPLREWLHRHAGDCLETYAGLGFELFQFTLETWPVENIPGRDAYLDENVCDPKDDIAMRAVHNDWVARYMLDHGTWNTPIVLLASRRSIRLPSGEKLKTPYHLLEGHCRLCSFQSLRASKRAAPMHSVWIVRLGLKAKAR
jgi:hypothetical protein